LVQIYDIFLGFKHLKKWIMGWNAMRDHNNSFRSSLYILLLLNIFKCIEGALIYMKIDKISVKVCVSLITFT
jgi:hypothetical protein